MGTLADEPKGELKKTIAMSEKKFAFNVQTGEFKIFEDKNQYELELSRRVGWFGVERKPKSSCNVCYGRGYSGRIRARGVGEDGKPLDIFTYVPCGCIVKHK
jgi:hypothetical protein